MMIRLLLALGALTINTTQLGHHWVQIARTPALVVDVGTATITKLGGILLLWERLRVAPHKLPHTDLISDRAVARVELNCWAGKSRAVVVRSYNGDSIVRSDNFDDAQFASIRQNSVDETVFRYACPRFSSGPR